MSFKSEFASMRQQGGSPKLTEEAIKQAEEVVSNTNTAPAESDPNLDLTQMMNSVVSDETVDPTPEPVIAIPPAKPEPKKVAVKINGKTFDSIEEATEYAAQIERELEKKEAVEKAVAELKAPKETPPAEVKKVKKIADKLFEDPEAAMEDLEQYILELADKRVEERENKKTEAQLRAEQTQKDVDTFYKTYSDLVDFQDEVNFVVDRNLELLKKTPQNELAAKVAELSRAYITSTKDKLLPKQVLPSKAAHTAGSSGKPTTATTEPATEKKVSFAMQVKHLNKRQAAQQEA